MNAKPAGLAATSRPASQLGEEALVPGTKAYEERVGTFAITEAEASRRLQEAYNVLAPDHTPRKVKLIVGEWYAFVPKEKLGMGLDGGYVNGMSGEIQWRECDRGFISVREREELKKGARLYIREDEWSDKEPIEAYLKRELEQQKEFERRKEIDSN